MRVGIYTDMAYWSADVPPAEGAPGRAHPHLSTDKAFIRLIAALADRIGEVVLFGRLAPQPGRAPYPVPADRIRFVPLPHYPSVAHLRSFLSVAPRTLRAFADELGSLDVVLVFGPHPVALAFALQARHAGVPLVLGVRHDYPQYVRHRLPGRGWGWAIPAAHALELAFRRLARTTPTAAVGPELARRYPGSLELGVSLVSERDAASPERALRRDWSGELRCLSVGRLAPEKNPLLLLDTIVALRRRDPRWRLVVAGDGPLRPTLEAAIAGRGLQHAVDLLGEVTNGPWLWNLYRQSHAFLHVSLTEGLPQVLVEANAAGTPVVATDVGGVAEALKDRGLLIPPRNAAAAADALERLAHDPALRRRLVLRGIEHARRESIEAQVEALTALIVSRAGTQPLQPHHRAQPAARGSARTPATGTARRPRTPAAQGTANPPD
jgi:glycosyltransferase involved in cell wall biosynthesis